jgi:hypothetical protein
VVPLDALSSSVPYSIVTRLVPQCILLVPVQASNAWFGALSALSLLAFSVEVHIGGGRRVRNISELWQPKGVVIYSPAVESGVSYTAAPFDRIYGQATGNAGTVEQFLQQLHRVRTVRLHEMALFFDFTVRQKLGGGEILMTQAQVPPQDHTQTSKKSSRSQTRTKTGKRKKRGGPPPHKQKQQQVDKHKNKNTNPKRENSTKRK